jgi:hypothetical protein
MNISFEYALKSMNAIKQSHFQCTEDLISHILDCNDVEKGTVIELFKPRKKFMEFYEILDRKFFPEIERDIDIIISMIHSFSLIDSDELISILKSLCIFKFYEEIKALSDEAHNKISEDIAKGRFISMEDEDIGETTIRKMNAGFVKIYKKFSVVFAEYAKSMQEVSAVYALSEYVQIDQFIRINDSLIELIDDRNMNDFVFSDNNDRIIEIIKEHIMLLDEAIKRPHQNISEENKNTLKQQLSKLSAVYIQLSNLKA